MGHFYYLGNGIFYSLGEGTLYFLGNGKFSSGNDFILWKSDHLSSGNRTTFPLGIGPLFLRESDQLSSGNRTTYPLGIGSLIFWETGHVKRDTLSSGNRTTYPLRYILGNLGRWISAILPSPQLTLQARQGPQNYRTIPHIPHLR